MRLPCTSGEVSVLQRGLRGAIASRAIDGVAIAAPSGVRFASTRGCAMHFLLSRSGARAKADADSYQHQLDSILAVARRQELESPAPERHPLPDDCPNTGEGFVWQVHGAMPVKTNTVSARSTTNRRSAHAYWRPILFLIIASLFIGSTWQPGEPTRPGTDSQLGLSTH